MALLLNNGMDLSLYRNISNSDKKKKPLKKMYGIIHNNMFIVIYV